jgi:hypothetical protein
MLLTGWNHVYVPRQQVDWAGRQKESEEEVKDVSEYDRYVEMDKVVTAMLKGENNSTRIAKELGMPRTRVIEYMDEWRKIAANDENIRERAKGAVLNLNQHYDLLIKELHDNSEEMKRTGDYKGSTTALKAAGDLEAKRQEALQKAGLLDDGALADQIVEVEEKMEAMKKLMVAVASKNPAVKQMIQEGLREIYGQAPAVPYTRPSETNEAVEGKILD